MKVYPGIDVGSVSTKIAVLNEKEELIFSQYLPTQGKPIEQICKLIKACEENLPSGTEIAGIGATGSARYLAGYVTGADIIKNEITSHAIAALHYFPDVQTVIEIGGQDSKLIIIRDGIVVDFAMNTVCAAGTGSFLDHQALRLGLKIEDFSRLALTSTNPVRIAGRCTVFAESDMIHKQQVGHNIPDILYGLCQALVRNYLSDIGLGKELKAPVLFQGGVAFNKAIIKAFQDELKTEIIVPNHNEVMGAIGVALLAKEEIESKSLKSKFKGFELAGLEYQTNSFMCSHCSNQCEIIQIKAENKIVARWGGRCERWQIDPNGKVPVKSELTGART
jgi:predicted CoA-substrate-specific enzyme activase